LVGYSAELVKDKKMEEKSWNEMNGWEKAGEVAQIGLGILCMILAFGLRGLPMQAPKKHRTTAWKPKFYRPTGCRKGWKY